VFPFSGAGEHFAATSRRFPEYVIMRLHTGRGAAENTQDVDYPLGWAAMHQLTHVLKELGM
jgi:hypothetical protein